ncbi:MAG TPA: ABC-type transport auxiliary lipoprotein family protein [Candidatus Sulfotelmatobacter sp.]|nr:ABC-type transport auxiliary lipoprotein family protein [Candidatus Sulfotelmatobacter sp.]
MNDSVIRLPKMASGFRSILSVANPAGLLAGSLVLTLLLAGCGAPRPIKYYGLSYPTKSTVAPDAVNASLMVRPFEASPLYLDNKIVYGFDSPEMGTYEFSRWANSPVEIMQIAFVRGLRSTGRFQAVYTVRSDPNGRFILGGHLYDFKEVDSSSNVLARLTFVVYLRDRKTGRTVWDYSYNHDEPASEKSITAFVEAMNKNLQRSVQEVDAGLQKYFSANPVQ